MPTYFVKQPNGRLARFTTIVDGFTHMNLTREEAISLALVKGQEFASTYSESAATGMVERALADESGFYDEGKPRRADGLKRWHGCIEIIRLRDKAEYELAVERGTLAPV